MFVEKKVVGMELGVAVLAKLRCVNPDHPVPRLAGQKISLLTS